MKAILSHKNIAQQQHDLREAANLILSNYELSIEERRSQVEQLGFKQVNTDQGLTWMTFDEYKSLIYSNARQIEPDFVLDDHFKEVMTQLSYYFWGDVRFTGSLKKGIYLAGNVGVGKTLMFKIFKSRVGPLTLSKIVGTNAICNGYQAFGVEYIFSNYGIQNKENPSRNDIVFDDLGSERISVSHMGNAINVMEQLILHRYEIKNSHRYTHFTTNLAAKDLERLYGTRVASRLNEMVNFLVLKGSDRRK